MSAVLASCGTKPVPRADGLCGLTQVQVSVPLGEGSLQPICDGVYAEPGLTDAEHHELKRAHRTARGNIAGAFGSIRGQSPITLFCRSARCKEAFGASPGSAASNDLGFARDGVETAEGYLDRPTVIVTGPVAGTARILTHELVHAEMKAYVPYDALPTWFNEGVATMIANEPDCHAHQFSSWFDVKRLDTKEAWQAHIRTPGGTLEAYCEARNEVAAWAESFGDRDAASAALKAVLTRVADGGGFTLDPP